MTIITKQINQLETGDYVPTKNGLLEVVAVRRINEGEGKHPIQVTFQDAKGKQYTTPYTSPLQYVGVQGKSPQQTLFT